MESAAPARRQAKNTGNLSTIVVTPAVAHGLTRISDVVFGNRKLVVAADARPHQGDSSSPSFDGPACPKRHRIRARVYVVSAVYVHR